MDLIELLHNMSFRIFKFEATRPYFFKFSSIYEQRLFFLLKRSLVDLLIKKKTLKKSLYLP